MNLIYEISFFSEIITDEVCFDGRPDNQCFDDNAACTLTNGTYKCICKDDFYNNTASKCTPRKF